MHSNKMTLFNGPGKRLNDDDEQNQQRKKAKISTNTTLLNIRYYCTLDKIPFIK